MRSRSWGKLPPPGLAQQQKGLREIVEVGTTEAPEGKGRGSWDCGKSLHGPAGRASMGPAHNEVRAKLSLNSELPTLSPVLNTYKGMALNYKFCFSGAFPPI